MTADQKSTEKPNSGRLVRLSVNMNRETADALKEISSLRGLSATETVRRAIGVLKFLIEIEDRGGKMLIKEKGELKEVVFIP